MAVQYAGGTNVNTTFTNTTGTRREIVDGLVSALSTAGWSTVSGGGTGDVKMRCATTPVGNVLVVRIYDPGSGNCARLQLYTTDSVKQQAGDIFLFPTTGKVWRVIANKYQFFIFVPGSTATREFASCSALYIPPFLVTAGITVAGFLQGQSKNDTDTSTNYSLFRSLPSSYYNNGNWQQNSACVNYNYIIESNNVTNSAAVGVPQCVVPFRFNFGGGSSPYRFADLSWMTYDPWMAFATSSIFDEALIRGMMWDMVVIGEANIPPDTTITYDGRSFYNITFGNNITNHSFCVLVP